MSTQVQLALFAGLGSADRCHMHGPHPHNDGWPADVPPSHRWCLGCPQCRGAFRFCAIGRCTKQAGHHDEHGQGR